MLLTQCARHYSCRGWGALLPPNPLGCSCRAGRVPKSSSYVAGGKGKLFTMQGAGCNDCPKTTTAYLTATAAASRIIILALEAIFSGLIMNGPARQCRVACFVVLLHLVLPHHHREDRAGCRAADVPGFVLVVEVH
jgi:hypothetical protein